MKNDGKQMLLSTRKFRKYLNDIGHLLLTAEDIMRKDFSFEKAGSAAVELEASQIRDPKFWLSRYAFRFFKHENAKNQHILTTISVIIDNPDKPVSFEQPIVSAAWFDYGEGNEVGQNFSYRLATIILSLENFSLDGKMIDMPPNIIDKFSSPSLKILSCMALAVPLVDIRLGSDIEEKVITPLIGSLNGKIN